MAQHTYLISQYSFSAGGLAIGIIDQLERGEHRSAGEHLGAARVCVEVSYFHRSIFREKQIQLKIKKKCQWYDLK